MESEEICATLQDLATKYNLPNYHINHHYSAENGNEIDEVDEVEEVTEEIPLNIYPILEETVSEEAMDLELQTIPPMPQMDVSDEVHEPPYRSTAEEDLILSHSLENIDEVQFEMPQPQSQNLVEPLDIPTQGKSSFYAPLLTLHSTIP